MNQARVLVVDDNRDMASGIAMLLREAELDVQVAHSAKGALATMEGREFELVLSDVRMPEVDGLGLLATIRSRWPLTKVVLLTAYGTVDSAVDAMRTGACDYLTKPCDNGELVRIVRRAIRQGRTSGGFDVAAVVGDVAAAASAGDLLAGLRSSLGVLVQATGADDGEIFLCEPEGRDPILCVWAGPDGEPLVARTRFEMGLGIPGIVAETGRPLCVKGGLADDARYLRRAVVDAGMRSLVAVPLPGSPEVLGSIHLLSRRDDFPVEQVLDLLDRAAVPIASAVSAKLAALRQSVDASSGEVDDPSRQVRGLLDAMRHTAGAQYGSLALLDPATGRPNQVVSTGSASLVCKHVEGGDWSTCPSLMAAHGFIAGPGRRKWPAACRRGLPRRAASPCCLPLLARGRLYGLVVLDFGREGTDHAIGRLVPLLSMTQQLAIRLQSLRAGFAVSPAPAVEVSSGPDLAPPELELRCLGPFAVLQRGRPIAADAFTRSKALVLLKLLALKEGAPINRDVLIEHIWPEVDPRRGANRLHGLVHDLRSVIEPRWTEREWLYVHNRGELYHLDVDAPIDIDVTRFRRLASQGMRGSERNAIALLEQAIELYRGDLFEDDPFAEWCRAEREELHDIYVLALEHLAQLYTQQGHEEESLTCLRRASRASPFRDDLILAEMVLLVRLGRAHEAVVTYDEYQRRLAADLDAEPPAELRAHYLRLLKLIRKAP